MTIDKQSISEVLMRYCRAIDRRDADLMRKVYWPDAIDDHAVFKGNVEEFLAYSFPFMEGVVSSHAITNILIDVDGDRAVSEAYVTVALRTLPGGDRIVDMISRGRYLDQWSKRDGRWAIAARRVVFDWSRVDPASPAYWDLAGLDEAKLLKGRFGADDPIYRHLGITRG